MAKPTWVITVPILLKMLWIPSMKRIMKRETKMKKLLSTAIRKLCEYDNDVPTEEEVAAQKKEAEKEKGQEQ
jgi:hypothetical protein